MSYQKGDDTLNAIVKRDLKFFQIQTYFSIPPIELLEIQYHRLETTSNLSNTLEIYFSKIKVPLIYLWFINNYKIQACEPNVLTT